MKGTGTAGAIPLPWGYYFGWIAVSVDCGIECSVV